MQATRSLERKESDHESLFREIYLEHAEQILIHAFHLTNCKKRAEDIRQEVFLAAWVKRERIFEIENLRWYLITCCRNVYFNSIRKSKRLPQLSVPVVSDHYYSWNNVEECIQETELRKLFSETIDLIPNKRRLIFLLLHEGATYNEVANLLSLSICTVKGQRQIAVNSIRAIISKEWDIHSYCKRN